MSAFTSLVLATVGSIAACAAFGHQIDGLLLDTHRNRISNFVFADRSATFGDFEKSVIVTLVGLFLDRDGSGHLSARRVLVLSSVPPAVGIITLLIARPEWLTQDGIGFAIFLSLFFLCGGIYYAFAGDYWSIWVSKRIFVDRSYRVRSLPLLWLLSFLLTTLPTLCIVVAYAMMLGSVEMGTTAGQALRNSMFTMGLIGSLLSAFFIALMQAATIIIGSIMRPLVRTTRYLDIVARNSRAHQQPFTVILAAAAAIGNVGYYLADALI